MKPILFLLILLNSLCSFAQIKISKANGVDISKYQTFCIQRGQVVSAQKLTKTNENRVYEMVVEAVKNQLTIRGYKLVPDSLAQLVVSYVYDQTEGFQAAKPGPLGQTPINDPAVIDGSYRNKTPDTRVLILDIEQNNSSIWTANCLMNGAMKDLNKVFELTIESAFKKFPLQGKGGRKR